MGKLIILDIFQKLNCFSFSKTILGIVVIKLVLVTTNNTFEKFELIVHVIYDFLSTFKDRETVFGDEFNKSRLSVTILKIFHIKNGNGTIPDSLSCTFAVFSPSRLFIVSMDNFINFIKVDYR